MVSELEWFSTHGLIGGMTVQFAEGHWEEEIGSGIALNWDAFELIKPVLASCCVEWTPMHAYGALELSPTCIKLMADELRKPDIYGRTAPPHEKELRSDLAGWLTEHLDAVKRVSFLGV
jgi:hypothetical protein